MAYYPQIFATICQERKVLCILKCIFSSLLDSLESLFGIYYKYIFFGVLTKESPGMVFRLLSLEYKFRSLLYVRM